MMKKKFLILIFGLIGLISSNAQINENQLVELADDDTSVHRDEDGKIE